MKSRILIVEDERTALRALQLILEDEGYQVLEAATGDDGLRLALNEHPDLILLDIRLPDVDGLTVLQRLRGAHSDAAVIMMTAETSSANAIRATQYGAFDYLSKPIDDEHLLLLIRRALEYRQLERDVRSLRTPRPATAGVPGMVGHTPAMQEIYKTIGRVADSAATVLVTGESGTGKELVANALHEFSGRRDRPLIKVNCAAIPGELLEAELFGYEKGAFTHAVSRRLGRFEQARDGTLFLDEVGDLPFPLQAKLLRALQERTIERLGGSGPLSVDFRLVAATSLDLSAAVAAGRFREDLYYRLNVVSLALPPLRSRREDIPLLVQRFLGRSEKPVTIRQDALDKILAHDWPGNVRELENVITRAVVLAPGGVVTPETIEFPLVMAADGAGRWEAHVPYRDGYWPVLRRVETELVRAALREAGGNKTEAARILGVQRRLLYQKMAELGLT